MLNSNLIIASNAAIKAGAAIMDVYNSDFEVITKSDNSPLTLADQKANDIINSFLRQTKIPILSEENKQREYHLRKDWEEVWVVDPLDGTKEFVTKNDEFTVNIALVRKGRPVLGVIFVPVTRSLYLGDVEQKHAYKMTLPGYEAYSEEMIKTATLLQPDLSINNVIRVVGSRSHMNEDTKAFIETLRAEGKRVEIVSRGSSLKFCIVAEGKADVYPRYAPTMEWDTAAGQAICEASGAYVIDIKTKNPLQYNKKNLLNPYFLVGLN
jgi:3'(2'), 5'-bisphosphate nucleotidase